MLRELQQWLASVAASASDSYNATETTVTFGGVRESVGANQPLESRCMAQFVV